MLLCVFIVYKSQGDTVIGLSELTERTHRTWEGIYKLTDEQVIYSEGNDPLHLLLYRHGSHAGTLLEFAVPVSEDDLLILWEPNTNIKGSTPMFESVDMLPQGNEAVVIVRWRYPGQGGERSVQMFHYHKGKLKLIAHSGWMLIGGKRQWIDMTKTADSTPATLAPAK